MNSLLWFLLLALLTAALAWLRSPAVTGRAGEWRVSRKLRRAFAGGEFRLFHNIVLPTERGTAQVDLLALSGRGIFVVEVKTLRGRISGGPQRKRWRQQIGRRGFAFPNPVHQNHGHVQAVRSALQLERGLLVPAVVFAGRCQLSRNIRGLVLTPGELGGFVRGYADGRIPGREIDRLSRVIMNVRLPPGRSTDRLHRQNVKMAIEARRGPEPCPRCGGPMTKRRAGSGIHAGNDFWGCLDFPRCRGTRPIDAAIPARAE